MSLDPARGSAPATDDALRAMYPSLRRFAAVVGPDEVEPDDLVHDALVATLRRTGLDALEHPEAYVRRVIVNLSANHRRRFGRGRRALGRLAARHQDVASDAYPSDVDELSTLSPEARAVVFLHHVEGRSYAEIAADLDITEVGARALASRSLRRLRDDHEKEGDRW